MAFAKKNSKRKKRGFTLIELLLVIGIIAILASIVIIAINPRLNIQTAQTTSARKQAKELQTAIVQHIIDHGTPPNNITTTPKIVCADHITTPTGICEIVLKTALANSVDSNYNYIAQIPRAANADALKLPPEDSGFRVSTDGTRYFVSEASTAVVTASVLGTGFYFKDSVFAQGGSTINAALSTSKQPLRSSSLAQSGTFINISNYTLGINGIILEIPNLTSSNLTASDFIFRVGTTSNPSTWATAPTPTSIVAIPSNDRVIIEWANNAIQNTWLQVIILATPNTGLSERDVLYFGSVPGEANGVSPYRTTSADVSLIQSGISPNPVDVNNLVDINKDGFVTTNDLNFVQSRVSATILLGNILFPASGTPEEG